MLLDIDQHTGLSHEEVSDPKLIVESWETWSIRKEVQMYDGRSFLLRLGSMASGSWIRVGGKRRG